MKNLLYFKELNKKLKNIQKIAIKNKYNEILMPLKEILEVIDKSNYNDKNPISNEIDLEQYKTQILAYYLSRFDHYDIYPNLNQNEALNLIANLLNIKKSTLRLARDYFDSKTTKIKSKESPYLKIRKGIDMPLGKKAQKIFDYYNYKKRPEITKDVLTILRKNNATTTWF